jgi:Family of unknown function (DUF5908)
MPLEIRELHIKVNVGESGGAQGAGDRAPGAPPPGGAGAEDKEKLLAACVDEVMRIMSHRKER